MKIIFDYDSTICNTHGAVLDLYREETNDYSTFTDDSTIQWNMANICPKWTHEEIISVFINPRLFYHMKPFENAIEVLNKLKKEGDILEICSIHDKRGIPFKEQWIKDNLPMIDNINILPIIEHGNFDKSSCVGDIAIDDRVDALLSYDCKYRILFGNYTWNKDFDVRTVPNCYRVADWTSLYYVIYFLKMKDECEGMI